MRNIRAYIDDEVKQQKWFVNNQDYILNNYRYAYWDIIDDYLDNNPSVFTKQKQFLKCNKEGIIVKTYDSIRKITDELNIKNGTLIYNCIKGKIKYAYGFIWKMKTSEIDAEKIANEIYPKIEDDESIVKATIDMNGTGNINIAIDDNNKTK